MVFPTFHDLPIQKFATSGEYPPDAYFRTFSLFCFLCHKCLHKISWKRACSMISAHKIQNSRIVRNTSEVGSILFVDSSDAGGHRGSNYNGASYPTFSGPNCFADVPSKEGKRPVMSYKFSRSIRRSPLALIRSFHIGSSGGISASWRPSRATRKFESGNPGLLVFRGARSI